MAIDEADLMKVQKNTFTRWMNKHLKKIVKKDKKRKVKKSFDVCIYL